MGGFCLLRHTFLFAGSKAFLKGNFLIFLNIFIRQIQNSCFIYVIRHQIMMLPDEVCSFFISQFAEPGCACLGVFFYSHSCVRMFSDETGYSLCNSQTRLVFWACHIMC